MAFRPAKPEDATDEIMAAIAKLTGQVEAGGGERPID